MAKFDYYLVGVRKSGDGTFCIKKRKVPKKRMASCSCCCVADCMVKILSYLMIFAIAYMLCYKLWATGENDISTTNDECVNLQGTNVISRLPGEVKSNDQ